MSNKAVPPHIQFPYQDISEGCCSLRYSAVLLLQFLKISVKMLLISYQGSIWHLAGNQHAILFLSIQFAISSFPLNLTEISNVVFSLCTLVYFWVCFLFCFIWFPGAFEQVLRSSPCSSHWRSVALPWRCLRSHFLSQVLPYLVFDRCEEPLPGKKGSQIDFS